MLVYSVVIAEFQKIIFSISAPSFSLVKLDVNEL